MWKSEQTRRIGRWSVTTWWTKARRSSDTGRTSQGMLHPLSGGPVWRKTVTHVLAPFVTHVLALHTQRCPGGAAARDTRGDSEDSLAVTAGFRPLGRALQLVTPRDILGWFQSCRLCATQ